MLLSVLPSLSGQSLKPSLYLSAFLPASAQSPFSHCQESLSLSLAVLNDSSPPILSGAVLAIDCYRPVGMRLLGCAPSPFASVIILSPFLSRSRTTSIPTPLFGTSLTIERYGPVEMCPMGLCSKPCLLSSTSILHSSRGLKLPLSLFPCLAPFSPSNVIDLCGCVQWGCAQSSFPNPQHNLPIVLAVPNDFSLSFLLLGVGLPIDRYRPVGMCSMGLCSKPFL